MKIEIGESLLLSWLRHAKNCQVVQTNWKPSFSSWELKNEEAIQKLMEDSNSFFKDKYGYEIYKETSSYSQLIKQAEVDVLGISFNHDGQYIYAVDVAFHENGLNYQGKDKTVMKVLNKVLRTAMCIFGYFGHTGGDIIFTSPKIGANIMGMLVPCLEEASGLLKKNGLNYHVRLIANHDFNEKILQPVLASTSLVADTSELFMRSLQMYNLFSDKNEKGKIQGRDKAIGSIRTYNQVTVSDIGGLGEMKIGVLVRSTLTGMFSNNEISPEEVELMQTAEYSKKTFDIQYPLLVKSSLSKGQKPPRYWGDEVEIYGGKYFICSEWYETPQNNDRVYFMNWLADKKAKPENQK